MPSRDERNAMYNVTTIFDPLGGDRARRLWVSSTSTGTVALDTLVVIDGTETWETIETYAAGSGDIISQGDTTMRLVPSDSTTYFKFL
jgi:hypothetical protein